MIPSSFNNYGDYILLALVLIVGEEHRDLESNLEQQRGKMKDRETENLKEK